MRLQIPSGSLNKFTFTSKKNGKTYPLVDGDRDPKNPAHWNWSYSYKQRTPSGKFCTRSVSVARKHLATVESMITSGCPVPEILTFLQKKPRTPPTP